MATLPERGIAGALPVHHSWIENRATPFRQRRRLLTRVRGALTRDPRRRALPWWYPYTPDHARAMEGAGRALHGGSLRQRLPAQLALLRSRRLWAGMSPLDLLRNVDKLL